MRPRLTEVLEGGADIDRFHEIQPLSRLNLYSHPVGATARLHRGLYRSGGKKPALAGKIGNRFDCFFVILYTAERSAGIMKFLRSYIYR
jgi:hypothetical protein